MATTERPWINAYELDSDGVEQLVYRQMNDTEYAQYEADQQAQTEQAAAYQAAPATAEDHATASADIITQKLASVPIPREQLPTILNQLLSEAVSAIPYYEGYTLTPDTATAWTNFQALDQPTKDRILYNACRSLAAIMRYLSGNLPA